ncbi:hypothetical protein BY458DRAFT_493716 [Sporodiniella umbellata]|nr:hypothetical protein BY458DRAFT_493716 [Sporodiniella umbellata]
MPQLARNQILCYFSVTNLRPVFIQKCYSQLGINFCLLNGDLAFLSQLRYAGTQLVAGMISMNKNNETVLVKTRRICGIQCSPDFRREFFYKQKRKTSILIFTTYHHQTIIKSWLLRQKKRNRSLGEHSYERIGWFQESICYLKTVYLTAKAVSKSETDYQDNGKTVFDITFLMKNQSYC